MTNRLSKDYNVPLSGLDGNDGDYNPLCFILDFTCVNLFTFSRGRYTEATGDRVSPRYESMEIYLSPVNSIRNIAREKYLLSRLSETSHLLSAIFEK